MRELTQQQMETQRKIVTVTKEYIQWLEQEFDIDLFEWTVGFMEEKNWLGNYNNLGECNYLLKTITYSNIILDNDFDIIEYLIKHEISHIPNRNEGHGKNWKKLVKRIGGSPYILRFDSSTRLIAEPRK